MIDNASLLLFGLLVVYTVFRAIKLDKLIPWFSAETKQYQVVPKKKTRR
jgi:uncharacterized paraquat-inducible protein A